MRVLRALDSNIGRQYLGSLKLRLRLRDIRFWRRPALEAILRQPQRFGIRFYGIAQKSLLGVGAPDLEIVDRNFGMESMQFQLSARSPAHPDGHPVVPRWFAGQTHRSPEIRPLDRSFSLRLA